MSHRWEVVLRPDPFSIQHWCVWAGLSALASQGVVHLRHRPVAGPGGRGLWLHVADYETGVEKTLWIDTSDRTSPDSVRRDAADSSWIRNGLPGSGLPLGFVAPMRSGHEPRGRYIAAAAMLSLRERASLPVRAAVDSFGRSRLPVRIEEIESEPRGDASIFFQVRCWEPDEGFDPVDRHHVNDARAGMIRTLRSQFGERFTGGFQSRPYALEHYPDCVSPLPFDQPSYLRALDRAAVVVATTGLYGSIPWKMAEYAAKSKAVVAEHNDNAVPDSHRGVFAEFATIEECLTSCDRLLSDAALRHDRQEASRRLWLDHVRPDRLMHDRLVEEFGTV